MCSVDILCQKKYSYTYEEDRIILTKNGVAYTYGDSVWKDKLTAVGDETISYDAQGNPTTYLGHTLTWEKGRQLKSFDSNTYTYNANGIRTSKTVNGVTHAYTLVGAKILQESWDTTDSDGIENTNVLIPLYDNEDNVCGILYNGTPYYFLKNLQGDIIAIADQEGTTVARYTYDAWGVCTIAEDTSGSNIAAINPFRYRGYYYDAEIGMYYLQSRYYDPVVGRFANGDACHFISVDTKSALCNLFNYGENNPVNKSDPTGRFSWSIFSKLTKFLTELAGDLGEFLLKHYGLSRKKYAHKLKYRNASDLIKFVNDNKKKIKKSARGFSNVASCLEVLILASESYNSIKDYSKKELLKVVATLAFKFMVEIIGEIMSKAISYVLSRLIPTLVWARFIIETILDALLECIQERPWVTALENKFVGFVNKANIGSYFVALIQASKAVFA